ncbi:hypothetical protein P3T76_012565 [Phytophthora citrophthora]|uniref:EF-hand domain-containing protein n=1 Tax=Phytophthora citrophthora TaxID=4793 RepID=A0AAD9G595_9STRA|nr:hypothetical protein P3T76_012565 [Phytophthora citrophthora]
MMAAAHFTKVNMGGGSLFQVGEDVEFWRVLVHLSILAFSLVLLEKALHRMEHNFPRSDKYQHMLKKVYRELMVLGLISLGLKILKESPDIDSDSKAMLAFQVADLTIFFLALVLIVQSTAVFLLLRNQNDRAERAELMRTQDLVHLVNESTESTNSGPSFVQTLLCCGRAAKKKNYGKRLVELRLLRRLFLRRFGFPQLFPFSKYLSRAQANQISHMIEVEPTMWVVLLIVAWGICGLLKVLEALDTDMPERQELVEAFMIVAWILLLLHLMVFLFFRSCVHYLLRVAAFNDDKQILIENLNAIAQEEAKAWQSEEADKALEIMSSIQEHHEELEYQRLQRQRKLSHKNSGRLGALAAASIGKDPEKSKAIDGVVSGSPKIDIRFFSYKAWHVSVILLLVLNGFLITLFVQCAVYDLDEIYEDFGALATILVPLPLALNALYFQRHIFYDFVVVSSTLRIDSHTLSDVVENFSETVHLRSEFATSLHQLLTQQELTVEDLQAELKAHDANGTGFIDVDDLRVVLAKFGFRLTRYRFNSVVKLLFELEGTTVSFAQVIRLVVMVQNENLVENAPVPAHPLLRPSVMVYDNEGQPSVLSQSNYNLHASTRQLPLLEQSKGGSDDFVSAPMSSFALPPISQRGVKQSAMVRPSVSSHALHDMFNLHGLQESRGSLFQVGEDVEFWRVLIHLSILAFCLVLFEGALHKLEHKFPPSEKYQHMLKKAYRELILGLKIIKEIPDIDSYSKTMLAFQVADLTIFLLALALILQSTGVFLLLRNQNGRAERAELISTQDLIDSVNGSKTDEAVPSFFQTLFCCGRSAKKTNRELVELRLLRRLFLRRFGLPQLFPYSKYLSRAQAHQIAHMIEVEPAMWIVLLIVAWSICGLLEVLKTIDTDMPESHELVEAFVMFAWVLLLLHVMVCLYFRSCVHNLLHLAAFSNDKATLVANLNVIAVEEAEAWRNEEADKALEVMGCIQEHHEELELQRERNKKAGVQNDKRRESFSGVIPGSPSIELRSFSHKGWHIGVMLLLILNGFLITLFVQCAFYDMDDIYEDFGTLPTVMVPLPLVINAVILQRHIFYDFVIVSNTLRINSHTLSDVVENFSEVVRLRSEFATTLLGHITQQELAITDLQAELKARDRTSSGFIDVDDLREVLSKFGFRVTRFRFNSVVKLLFELEGTTVAYAHVVRLVLMAQNENLYETMSVHQPHPLLRPSVMMCDDLGQSSMRSQSNYNIFNSTRQVPVMAPPSMDEPSPSDFVSVAMSSNILPQFSHRGANANGNPHLNIPRPSVSSQALHDIFNLQRLSNSHAHSGIVRL